jgi:hypothetical protein
MENLTNPQMSTERELANHGADIRHLQVDMDKLVSDMEDMKKTLTAISLTLSEARGGWKVLMLVGGAGGALGAGILQIIHYIAGK